MSIPIPVNELSDWVDGISIPNSIRELSEWAQNGGQDTDLSSWLNLLDLESQAGLAKILKAPLIKNKSMARQILRSWVGRQLLDELSDLVRLDDDRSGKRVFNTLESLLESQPQVTTIDLLEALPGKNIYLDLDAFLQAANRWRNELKSQQKLVFDIGRLPSKPLKPKSLQKVVEVYKEPFSIQKALEVDHREDPLKLEIWRPDIASPQRSSWIVFMPGWGGTPDHFRWLARRLSRKGWPVVLLEHPGSDAKAVQELLEGRRLAPGAEVLPDRLADLFSVIEAKKQGDLEVSAEKLVLMGHSLGALTAFLASGATPEPDLEKRCRQALDALSLTNISQLLQCQMVDVQLQPVQRLPQLEAIVAINSFGSLLWPTIESVNNISPVFLMGGTYDLITPALTEQLGLLLSTSPNLLSRILLIEGASHFSPIRVEGQAKNASGDDLLQLGEAFVGVRPLMVQGLLGTQIIRFLENFELGKALDVGINQKKDGLTFHLLDRSIVDSLLKN
ncbi:alpha/beta hydrolase [Prochlorococcus sp. MIT 1307]|uniref:alpha/beta hydrolase n=1 Tax=Prochlorococcus sp. MIT 1307 TaxID=3096219 RepID=UPI002A7543B0|nr:alpha/beta hydrolase [Prochlorococcus sp. MIT 1307]